MFGESYNERTESTSPNDSKISYSLPSTCSPYPSKDISVPSSQILQESTLPTSLEHEASTESFKASSSSSSTTVSKSLPFGVAYKSESVPRACRVSSSSKLVLRTLYNLKETGFRCCERYFLSPLMLNWEVRDKHGGGRAI